MRSRAHGRRLRGRVREQWGQLTDDDVDIIAGRRDRLVGMIQQRYGTLKEEADCPGHGVRATPGRYAQPGQFVTWPLVGIFLLVAIAALKIGSTFVLPIVVSVLFTFLLGPPVRWLKKHRIPEALGAGVLVFGTVIVLCGSMYFLADPAVGVDRARAEDHAAGRAEAEARDPAARQHPGHGEQGGRGHDADRAAVTTPRRWSSRSRDCMSRLSGTTASFLGAALTVIFLTYFLLAAGTLFRQKLAEVLPGRAERAHVVEALAEIEVQMSRYLVLTTIINAVVGLLTWGALALLGMPNAALWGAVAGVLNYIPYVGALATLILIGGGGPRLV